MPIAAALPAIIGAAAPAIGGLIGGGRGGGGVPVPGGGALVPGGGGGMGLQIIPIPSPPQVIPIPVPIPYPVVRVPYPVLSTNGFGPGMAPGPYRSALIPAAAPFGPGAGVVRRRGLRRRR